MIKWENFQELRKSEILQEGPLVRYIWGLKIEYKKYEKKITINFQNSKINIILIENLLSLLLFDDHIWDEHLKTIKINEKLILKEQLFEKTKIKKNFFKEENEIEIEYSKEECVEYELNCIIYPIWKNKNKDYSFFLELERW